MDETNAVLVTGASTGIGRRVTELLAGAGRFVYAGARKESDLQALNAIKNVHAMRLDVTSAKDIAAAVDAIRMRGHGLYGLVNNAGIVTLGSVVDGSDEEFDLVMAVNVRAVYCVTKAFAPLIIAAKGRIVTVGALQGILADRNVSAYSMSKHAVEAFTDSLAAEMQPLGVDVSVVEPGAFHSEIGRNAITRTGANPQLPDFSQYKDPEDVAVAIALALFERRPKRRYLVVPNEGAAQRTIRKQIEQLVQLNEGHPYTLDRNALIEMLDKALAASRPQAAYRLEVDRGRLTG